MCSDQTKSELNIYNPHRQFCYVLLCVACNEFCQDHLRKPTKIDAYNCTQQSIHKKVQNVPKRKRQSFYLKKDVHALETLVEISHQLV